VNTADICPCAICDNAGKIEENAKAGTEVSAVRISYSRTYL
jgi:hypothetical protein